MAALVTDRDDFAALVIFISVVTCVLVMASLSLVVLACGCCRSKEPKTPGKSRKATFAAERGLSKVSSVDPRYKTLRPDGDSWEESGKSGDSKSKSPKRTSPTPKRVRVRWASKSTRILTEDDLIRQRDARLAEEQEEPSEVPQEPPQPPPKTPDLEKSVGHGADRAAEMERRKPATQHLVSPQMRRLDGAEEKRKVEEEEKQQKERNRQWRRLYREMHKKVTVSPVGQVPKRTTPHVPAERLPPAPTPSRGQASMRRPPEPPSAWKEPRAGSVRTGPSIRERSDKLFVPDHATISTGVFVPVSTRDKVPSSDGSPDVTHSSSSSHRPPSKERKAPRPRSPAGRLPDQGPRRPPTGRGQKAPANEPAARSHLL